MLRRPVCQAAAPAHGLGVNGTVIIAHGRSNETAVANAVAVARQSAERDLIPAIVALVAQERAHGNTGTGRDESDSD